MKKIKNIAIIAHVDHGKTTLVDQLLRQSGAFRSNENIDERVMDSNDLEKERGITILAKNTAIEYEDYHINILDTPGHADFSGEVERILKMVDGVLLIVDAFEGCMPQTRFVLKKALEQHLTPIVVLNKIDRPMARPEQVVDEVIDLLIELGAEEDQLDFPVVYASAINGVAGMDYKNLKDDMSDVFKLIIDEIPNPENDPTKDLKFQVSLLDYNDFVGRIGIGRIFSGKITSKSTVNCIGQNGEITPFKVQKLYGFKGLKRIEVESAQAGEIVAIVGKEDISVGDTVTNLGDETPLDPIMIEEPTLQMTFLVNNSPFAGKEGKYVTARKIEERLQLETKTDVSLRVLSTEFPDQWIVCGRGELHLSILIENLRREGYEFQVSKPEVIIREENGVKMEPVEDVQIDTPSDTVGAIIESLGYRKAEMQNMQVLDSGQTRLTFRAYSRGLIGYTTEFITLTKGYGIMSHSFLEYAPYIGGEIGNRKSGSLVSMETGKATTYAIMLLEERGTIFIEPGTEVYEGMIVGENSRENDLAVNIVRMKQQTNVRSANKDTTSSIKKPKIMSLEQTLEYLSDDEYCEITPENIRLRKKVLNKSQRDKENKRKGK